MSARSIMQQPGLRPLLFALCCITSGSVFAQSASLDMDVDPAAPVVANPPMRPAVRENVLDAMAPLGPKAEETTTGPAEVVVPPGTTPTGQMAEQPPPEPITLDHPRVIDTATLQAGDTVVSLFGIEGAAGDSALGLQGFLESSENRLNCLAQASAGFVCLLPDGTDIAQVALVNGAAQTREDAPDAYREQEVAAQTARRGVWVNLPPPPETLAHPGVLDTATIVVDSQRYILDGVVGLGAPYSSQLQGYIAANGDSLTCSPQVEPNHFICVLPDGTDLAKVALVNGAAQLGPSAPDAYRLQQLDALNNRRGYWLSANDVAKATARQAPRQEQITLVSGDEGTDGITYVGGAPEVIIQGQPTFLIYGDGLGWGYYDRERHWHGAPDRFRRHMERFHPGGEGLHGRPSSMPGGPHSEEAFRRNGFAPGGREDAMRPPMGGPRMTAMARPPGIEPGLAGRPAGMPGGFHPGPMPGAVPPGGMPGAFHPGAMPGAFHPGAMHPTGMPSAMAPGGMPGSMHPAAPSFMRPAAVASAGGFHPGGPLGGGSHPGGMGGGGFHPQPAAMHAAPAAHASSGSSGRHH